MVCRQDDDTSQDVKADTLTVGVSVWGSVGVTVSTTLTPPFPLYIKVFCGFGWGVRIIYTGTVHSRQSQRWRAS